MEFVKAGAAAGHDFVRLLRVSPVIIRKLIYSFIAVLSFVTETI